MSRIKDIALASSGEMKIKWVERNMPGPRAKQQARIQELALDYQCALQFGMGFQVFEKLRPPYTG